MKPAGEKETTVQIEHWDPDREGPFSEDALRRKLERRGYDVSRYVYPPGTYFANHRHAVEKIDTVVSGRFRMTLKGRNVILEAGDCLLVPAGAVHSAEVVGSISVVSLDATKMRAPVISHKL